MKTRNGLLIAAAVVCSLSTASTFAKTAKECTADWRADKAGMQARGVTEKAYVEQCKGGAEPTAAAPAAKPAETASPAAPRQATATGSKTAKECTAEWRADKAGMQARGVTEKAYVEQCKAGAAPTASAPAPQPTAATPAAPAAPTPTSTSSSKTAKECIAEWRADKAGMQARGVTQRAYIEQCKTGAMPSATAPAPKPTAAPPASQPAPTATEAAPTPAPQKPTSTTTAAPSPTTTAAPTPAQKPSAPEGNETMEAGQFADEASAKARCPTDTVVWVNLPSKVYHFAGTKNYGTTKRGSYMCEKEAIAAEDRASKTEKHP
jgi:hypothetical protein